MNKKQRGSFFVLGIVGLFFASSVSAGCYDSGCSNVKNGDFWQITNCNVSNDADGDQQLCNWAGRVGTCGGRQFCCPTGGYQWTSDMSACTNPTPTNTPIPTSTPTNTPTPTPPPKADQPLAETATPLPVLSNPTIQNHPLFSNYSYRPAVGPVSYQAPVQAQTKPAFQPKIVKKGKNSIKTTRFTVISVRGTTYQDADVSYTIEPDNITGKTHTDGNGYWRLLLPTTLTAGKKRLIVDVKDGWGSELTIREPFTVPNTWTFPFTFVSLDVSSDVTLETEQ